jgi:hypothetical protein
MARLVAPVGDRSQGDPETPCRPGRIRWWPELKSRDSCQNQRQRASPDDASSAQDRDRPKHNHPSQSIRLANLADRQNLGPAVFTLITTRPFVISAALSGGEINYAAQNRARIPGPGTVRRNT